MTTGLGLALLGVWLPTTAALASPAVTDRGFNKSLLVSITMTILFLAI